MQKHFRRSREFRTCRQSSSALLAFPPDSSMPCVTPGPQNVR